MHSYYTSTKPHSSPIRCLPFYPPSKHSAPPSVATGSSPTLETTSTLLHSRAAHFSLESVLLFQQREELRRAKDFPAQDPLVSDEVFYSGPLPAEKGPSSSPAASNHYANLFDKKRGNVDKDPMDDTVSSISEDSRGFERDDEDDALIVALNESLFQQRNKMVPREIRIRPTKKNDSMSRESRSLSLYRDVNSTCRDSSPGERDSSCSVETPHQSSSRLLLLQAARAEVGRNASSHVMHKLLRPSVATIVADIIRRLGFNPERPPVYTSPPRRPGSVPTTTSRRCRNASPDDAERDAAPSVYGSRSSIRCFLCGSRRDASPDGEREGRVSTAMVTTFTTPDSTNGRLGSLMRPWSHMTTPRRSNKTGVRTGVCAQCGC